MPGGDGEYVYSNSGVCHITSGGAGKASQTPPGSAKGPVTVAKVAPHCCTVTVESDILFFQAIQPNGTVVDSSTLKDFKGTGKLVSKENAQPTTKPIDR